MIDNAIYHQNFGDSKAWYLLKRVLLDNLLDQIDQRARIKYNIRKLSPQQKKDSGNTQKGGVFWSEYEVGLPRGGDV